MTTTTPAPRRVGRRLLNAGGVGIVAIAAASMAVVTPATAAPEEGVRISSPTECLPVGWGWPDGADGPAYPGQRFGVFLAPQCRGPVLEGLNR